MMVAVLPMFMLILLGLVLRRFRVLADEFWSGAERLNYFVLFPVLLFTTLARAPWNSSVALELALGIAICLLLLVLLLIAVGRTQSWPADQRGAQVQALLRFNSYLALGLAQALSGAEGLALASVVMALLVPAVNVLSVAAYAKNLGIAITALLRNPLIWACVLGVMVSNGGLALPGLFAETFGLLAAASLPLGLLSVGAALRIGDVASAGPSHVVSALARLAFAPAVVFGVAMVLGLSPLVASTLTMFFALPTAPTAYVLAQQLGPSSAGWMAGQITLQTVFSMVSIPLVLWCSGEVLSRLSVP